MYEYVCVCIYIFVITNQPTNPVDPELKRFITIHNSPPPIPNMNQLNPLHPAPQPISLRSILIPPSDLLLRLPRVRYTREIIPSYLYVEIPADIRQTKIVWICSLFNDAFQ
jgi:hypothetical protein